MRESNWEYFELPLHAAKQRACAQLMFVRVEEKLTNTAATRTLCSQLLHSYSRARELVHR